MNTEMEDRLQEIGNLISQALEGSPDGAFLYAEVEPGMVAWGLFVDRGEFVECIRDTNRIDASVFGLWLAAEPDKKWSGLSYAIIQGTLDAQFHYPENWLEGEIYSDRRARILAARYGTKPIKYPLPLPPPPPARRG